MKDVIIGVPVQWYIYLSVVLFCIGVMGVLFRRNAIIMFMCIELMLNAVNLLMVAFSRYHGDSGGYHHDKKYEHLSAAEVAVGLAILMMIYRNIKSTDIDLLNKLKW